MAAISAAISAARSWWRAAASLLMGRHLISRAGAAPKQKPSTGPCWPMPSPAPPIPPSMPVNTAALKTFAPAMRRQLIEAVGRKLDRLLHQQQRRHAHHRRRPDRRAAAAGGYQSPGAAGAGGLQLVQSPGGAALSRCQGLALTARHISPETLMRQRAAADRGAEAVIVAAVQSA